MKNQDEINFFLLIILNGNNELVIQEQEGTVVPQWVNCIHSDVKD